MKKCMVSLGAILLLGVIKAQNPISASSRISKTEASTMSISRNDENAIIVTTNVVDAKKNDRFRMYIYGPTYSDGVIRIPSDGKTYWTINFNPSVQAPVKLICFGEITADCHCPSEAGCEIEACGQAEEQDGIVICPPGSCSGWDPEQGCGSCELPDAIAIIDADVVYYNGVQYRKQ
jgi:hypothetical protein